MPVVVSREECIVQENGAYLCALELHAGDVCCATCRCWWACACGIQKVQSPKASATELAPPHTSLPMNSMPETHSSPMMA